MSIQSWTLFGNFRAAPMCPPLLGGSDLSFLVVLGFPDFRGCSRLVLLLSLGLPRWPTEKISKTDRDTVRNFPKKWETPVWETPGFILSLWQGPKESSNSKESSEEKWETPVWETPGFILSLWQGPKESSNSKESSEDFPIILSEQSRPFLYKFKGSSKSSPQKVQANFAKNLGRQILGNTFAARSHRSRSNTRLNDMKKAHHCQLVSKVVVPTRNGSRWDGFSALSLW